MPYFAVTEGCKQAPKERFLCASYKLLWFPWYWQLPPASLRRRVVAVEGSAEAVRFGAALSAELIVVVGTLAELTGADTATVGMVTAALVWDLE